MKHLIKTAFIVLLLTIASGCETMEGLGKDIGKLGDAIEDSASE